ncbi:hypothetical protein ACHAPU_004169 [Fusarium lateritium]
MAPPAQPPAMSDPFQAVPGQVAQQPEQAAAAYLPQQPFPMDPGFSSAALLAAMTPNNEVLLSCLLALTAVVSLLAMAIIFVFVTARREAASTDRDRSIQIVIQDAVKEACEAAWQAEDKSVESEKDEEEEEESAANPDESLPRNDSWDRVVNSNAPTL